MSDYKQSLAAYVALVLTMAGVAAHKGVDFSNSPDCAPVVTQQ